MAKGLVRTREDTDRLRRTHQLETAEGGTCQDMQRNRPTETHSLPRDGRGRDLSEHAKKPTDRGPLTNWRQQREGLVRTQKETGRPRPTHILEMAEGGTCQDTQRNRTTAAHSHPGDGRGRDLSGHRKKPTDRDALTHWRWQREGLVRTRKETTDRGPLTLWRRQREGLVKTRKETDRPRCTHFLEIAEGGTCQDTERNRPTEAHSPTGDGRERDL